MTLEEDLNDLPDAQEKPKQPVQIVQAPIIAAPSLPTDKIMAVHNAFQPITNYINPGKHDVLFTDFVKELINFSAYTGLYSKLDYTFKSINKTIDFLNEEINSSGNSTNYFALKDEAVPDKLHNALVASINLELSALNSEALKVPYHSEMAPVVRARCAAANKLIDELYNEKSLLKFAVGKRTLNLELESLSRLFCFEIIPTEETRRLLSEINQIAINRGVNSKICYEIYHVTSLVNSSHYKIVDISTPLKKLRAMLGFKK